MSPEKKFEDPFFRDKFVDPIIALKRLGSSDLRKLAVTSGIDVASLENIAQGKVKPSKSDLEKISKALPGLGRL